MTTTTPAPLTSVAIAETWLFARLTTDPPLAALVGTRLFAGIAPEGTDYPLLTYQGATGADTTAPGMRRIITQMTYDVHMAVREASIAALDAIAARVDALLHGQQAYQFPSGAYTVACYRTALVPLAGQVAGVQTRELIASYTIIVQEAGDI